MKKEWVKPEVSSLGMENTNEDCTTLDSKGEHVHICNWCLKPFWTHDGEIAHEATCGKNPANPPATGGEGTLPLPTPALS